MPLLGHDDHAELDQVDWSSLRVIIHGAAPCPVDVKQAMIGWWGPVLHEYYAATEGIGYCAIDSTTWLERPGSVGRPVRGILHVVDEHGAEVGPDVDGLVYFEAPATFAYHNDDAKTASVRNANGWVTLGDVGHVDRDGYLFLTDRAADLIISGGVNIYPREIEDVLLAHPAVADVAVVGAPDPQMGERVVAAVVLHPGRETADITEQLQAFGRESLASYKVPRQIDLVADLPRNEAGKMLRRKVREQYRSTPQP